MTEPVLGRRGFVAKTAVALALPTTGCLSGGQTEDEQPESRRVGSPERDDDADSSFLSPDPSDITEGNASSSQADEHDSDVIRLPSIDVEGSPGGLVEVRKDGVVSVVNFFATWCLPCKPEMANLRAVRDRYTTEELYLLSITPESDEQTVATFWAENDGNWPVAMDPSIRASRRYDVTRIPTTITFAQDGTESSRRTGLVGEDTLIKGIEDATATGDTT